VLLKFVTFYKAVLKILKFHNVCRVVHVIQRALCTGAMPTSIESSRQIPTDLAEKLYWRTAELAITLSHFIPATSTTPTWVHRMRIYSAPPHEVEEGASSEDDICLSVCLSPFAHIYEACTKPT